MSKPPADYCLKRLAIPIPEGQRCTHEATKGQWLIQWEGEYYSIQPSTQLQKDIWLGDAKRRTGQDEAMALLRWLCHVCNTIQMP